MSSTAFRRLNVVAILLVIQACSNSAIVINPLYNRLDDRMRSSFAKQADFTDTQSASYQAKVENFHVWHRQTQLPVYASLLGQIQSSIKTAGTTTIGDVKGWMNTVEGFTLAMRECHPVNFSYDIIRSLTDEQVATLQKRWRERRAEHVKKYDAESAAQRIDRREKTIKKWASRIGFEFNGSQSKLLRQTLTDQISLRTQYFTLSDAWRNELFDFLSQREALDLDTKIDKQLNQLWHLLETAHPDEWRQNRALWAAFGHKLIGTLTREQRSYVTIWIRRMAGTLATISTEKVPNPAVSASIGCSRNDGA